MEKIAGPSGIPRKTGIQRKTPRGILSAFSVNLAVGESSLTEFSSPRLSQLDSCFIERGTLCLKRLRRSPMIVLRPWCSHSDEKPEQKPAPKERPDGMKLARHYQALLDSGKFESRAALARYLGVSRARVTQVLNWLLQPSGT